jgi:hypothetical protein
VFSKEIHAPKGGKNKTKKGAIHHNARLQNTVNYHKIWPAPEDYLCATAHNPSL